MDPTPWQPAIGCCSRASSRAFFALVLDRASGSALVGWSLELTTLTTQQHADGAEKLTTLIFDCCSQSQSALGHQRLIAAFENRA
jgi:hypothetical protein